MWLFKEAKNLIIMVMTRFSDENIAFEQQQKSRYLAFNESSDRHIGFPI